MQDAQIGLYDRVTSTTLESNKSHFKTPVEWPALFTCHSNPEKPPYACQTATRHV